MFPELKKNLYVKEFSNYELFDKINPDIFLLSEIAWYVLPEIKPFIQYIKKNYKSSFLINCLSIYDKGVQKYGKEYFSSQSELIKYFNLETINSITIEKRKSNSSLHILLSQIK